MIFELHRAAVAPAYTLLRVIQRLLMLAGGLAVIELISNSDGGECRPCDPVQSVVCHCADPAGRGC
jgi:hypothetical protein